MPFAKLSFGWLSIFLLACGRPDVDHQQAQESHGNERTEEQVSTWNSQRDRTVTEERTEEQVEPVRPGPVDPWLTLQSGWTYTIVTQSGPQLVHARRSCPLRNATCYEGPHQMVDQAICFVYSNPAACADQLRDRSNELFQNGRVFLIMRGPTEPLIITETDRLRELILPIVHPSAAGALVAFVDNDWGPFGPTAYAAPRGFRVQRASASDIFVAADGTIERNTSEPRSCRSISQGPRWLRETLAGVGLGRGGHWHGRYCEDVFGMFVVPGDELVAPGGAARDSGMDVGGDLCEMEYHVTPPAVAGGPPGGSGIRFTQPCEALMVP